MTIKRKRTKKLPVTQKLIIMMAVIMLFVNGILAYIIQDVMRSNLTETEHKYLSEIIKNIGNTSEQTVHEYVAICDVLAQNFAIIEVLKDSNQDNPMNQHPYATIVAEELNRIMDSYDDKIMSMAIFDVASDGMLLNTGEVSDESFSFQQRPYYAPVHTGKYVVTEPYLDILTNGLVVTIASPVFHNGTVLGVVGLDLPIDFLSHLVVESSYGESGRSLVLDNQNIILAYADTSYINQHYSALSLVGDELEIELEFPTGKLFQYEFEGELRLGMVSHLDNLDWKILTAMNYDEFDQLSIIIVILLLISVIVTFLVCSSIISGKLSTTLYQMNNLDTLTGLYNRSGYSYRLDLIMEKSPQSMGLVSVNMNGLRRVNDDLGSDEGDNLLKSSALLLKEQLDFEIFRMSGDEFLGLAPNIAKDEFEAQLTNLTKVMRTADNFDFAVGHAWSEGKIDINKLTFEADTIMYINKQEFYAKGGIKRSSINDSTLLDLLQYLEDKEFMVYLQPQVRLKDGTLYGAEALIRRYDKTNEKMVFPDQFISLYEQKSIIRHVDFFVIEAVCQLLSQWGEQGKAIPISVNLSRVTLQEYGIVDNVVKICDKYAVPHHLLVIEVTERVGLVENNVASALVSAFKDHGFHISLDDFGCAYSNIVTLAQIEVDEVKIDKSLVDDLTTSKKNHILVKNVLAMCTELEGASTLAEGIEDEAQAKLLHDLGCHLGQGYFYSRPLPVAEFEKKYLQ